MYENQQFLDNLFLSYYKCQYNNWNYYYKYIFNTLTADSHMTVFFFFYRAIIYVQYHFINAHGRVC